MADVGNSARDHAIVLGSSIAGLLAARVLARLFRHVSVYERDALPGSLSEGRAGVPQGTHTHVLLPGGARVLDRLFPGRLDELARDGAHRFDYGLSRFYLIGSWMPRIETGLYSYAQTRPFLEEHVRTWVSDLPNVTLHYESPVDTLILSSGKRVEGIVHGDERIGANLVIDATGRHTRLPRWLAENGFGTVREQRVTIGLGYTTGRFRIAADSKPDHPILYIVGPPPAYTRFGLVVSVEDGLVSGGLGGYHGDHPPADLPGFLAFAKTLSQPDVYDLISRAELVTPLIRYRTKESSWRRYGTLPQGILPIGDAICSLDPAFAQGMTVAALQAGELDRCLTEGNLGAYLRGIDPIVDTAWTLALGESLKYPQTPGRRPLLFRASRLYRDRVANCQDPVVTAEFYRVLTLTAPRTVLLRPGVVARAVTGSSGRSIRPVVGSAPSVR
jgi:flavin-dependent dehydrogenase